MDKLNKIVEIFDIDAQQTDDGLYLYPKTDSRAAVVASICIQEHIEFSLEWNKHNEPFVCIF